MIKNLKSQTDLSGLYIIYNGSTLLEKPGWYGISHLLEHLVCKSFDDLNDDFDRDGISWNAYTETNLINFHFTGLEENLKKYRNKIFDRIFSFDVTKEQFETERNIVLSEYEDYFNDQAYAHAMNLNRKLFNDFDPIGLREDLENMKFMDAIEFFELQYLKPSMVINVSKDFVLNDIPVEFNNVKIERKLKLNDYKVDLELNNDFKDKSSMIFLAPIVESDHAEVNLITKMLSMGLQSPLYKEIREKMGLVYYIQCYQSRFNQQATLNISTLTNNRNVNKLIDGVNRVLDDRKLTLNKDRLDVVKKSLKNRYKKQEILRFQNIDKYIIPENFQIESILDTITLDQLDKVWDKYFQFDKFRISNDKKEFR